MPISSRRFPASHINHPLLFALIGLSATTPGLSLAAPVNGVVTGGDASITVSGTNTAINQSTDRLSIDWDSFDISADERVEFLQPGQNSIALNRILSNEASQIFGQIDANGHVILMNPNGLIFGEGAEVNVGGLIASGLNIQATDFMNGELIFEALESGDGMVINRGLINAASGGNVALLGRTVANEGFVSANLGTVSLASGDQAVLTFDDAGMLGVQVTEETLRELGGDALVSNSGEIDAAGGRVLLTSKISQDIFSGAVNTDLPDGEMGVEVHEDGSFTLSGKADVVNAGIIDVTKIEENGETEEKVGDIALRGDHVEHSGSILVHSQGYSFLSPEGPRTFNPTVTFAGSHGVSINGGRISDSWAGEIDRWGMEYSSYADVIITGDYISMTESEITVGPGSAVAVGGRNETRRVFIDDAVISATENNPDRVSSGGDISIAADTSVVVAAELNVRGTTYDYRENYSSGGDVLLDSGGRLALSGQVLNSSGNEYQSSYGELVIAADTLVISDNGEPFTITPATLEAVGTTRLQAVRSLRAEGAPEFTLRNHFSAEATGNEDGDPGVIDLRGLLLDSVYPQYGRSSLTISMEADSIAAPQIGVHHSLTGTRPRDVNVELTARTGDILHSADVNTWTGEYRADAAGDVRFEGDAVLNTETYEEYPEGWGNGSAYIVAGGDIALTLENERPRVYSGPLVQLSGRNVHFSLPHGSLLDESQNLAHITAENLTVNSAGDFSGDAFVSGQTNLVAPAGGEWLMEGDINTLSVEAGDAINLTLNDANDLVLGDMVYANGSDVVLVAGTDGGTLSQQPDARIELTGTHLDLMADNIHLGANGTASVVMTGTESSAVEGDFISSLSLSGIIEYSDPDDAVTFRGTDAASAQITIGEHATFVNPPASPGTIQLGASDDVVDLAADLPLEISLSEGADVINLQAADVSYTLLDFDEEFDTIHPYVVPTPPTDGGPKPKPKPGHWPKPHHWGMPFWAYPHWYWKPGTPGYGPWGVHHRQKPGTHSFRWQPWFPSTVARR